MTKKQVAKIVVFILIVSWLLVHVTYCIRTNGDVKDRYVGFYSEKNNTIDAVMIGSSPVYPCISNPMIYGDMGITMYPLASNMQRPVATKYLVEEVLKTQTPDLFIFEMRMWTAEDENLLGNMAHTREVTDNLKYSINRIKTINAMVEDPSERLSYYFDIFKYHS
ncbi:MAG: SGNH/GDSL hydrolase family protein, partial [Butyrivibrio sp.]|nr:SGNH/GDSL hydrolase family protein [Butyrivibrio sp.]